MQRHGPAAEQEAARAALTFRPKATVLKNVQGIVAGYKMVARAPAAKGPARGAG